MVDEEYNIKINADMSAITTEFTKYMTTLNAALSLARKAGLPDDQVAAIQTIQKMISTLYMLRAAYTAIAIARAAAGDPLAIAGAAIAVGGVIVTLADVS